MLTMMIYQQKWLYKKKQILPLNWGGKKENNSEIDLNSLICQKKKKMWHLGKPDSI